MGECERKSEAFVESATFEIRLRAHVSDGDITNIQINQLNPGIGESGSAIIIGASPMAHVVTIATR